MKINTSIRLEAPELELVKETLLLLKILTPIFIIVYPSNMGEFIAILLITTFWLIRTKLKKKLKKLYTELPSK